MSTAATMSQPPVIPPRPSRSQEKSSTSSKDGNGQGHPKVPPRPIKRFDRSISPNPDRFAPSPLNESLFPVRSPKATRFSEKDLVNQYTDEPYQRPGSVTLPSLGEEGQEYAAVEDELAAAAEDDYNGGSSGSSNNNNNNDINNKEESLDASHQSPPSSPEQTRTIAQDLKLHAPKPSFPAQTAKQRVSAVTRTDSDKAASFGIGRPSSEELPFRGSIKKKKSTVSQMSESDSVFDDEEHGIPEIGQRVPMNPHLGDVQAPSPAPHSSSTEGVRSQTPRHHTRKGSSRGFNELPPGSYGLHGHGTSQPTDKLEKAWYDKHPESFKRESAVSLHDRQNDFAMSSTELNKIVLETRGSGLGSSAGFTATPSEEVGYQASDEYTQRMTSRPGSTQPRSPVLHRVDSPRKDSPMRIGTGSPAVVDDDDDDIIHVDESHDRSRSFHNASEENLAEGDEGYHAPILAPDEVAKDPHYYEMQPAVPTERRGSFYEEDASSRPTSRPVSIYNSTSQLELTSTPLEDVAEYEPLFPEEEEEEEAVEGADGKQSTKKTGSASSWKPRHKFPSKDIWEDAPDSVNATAVVSTPDLMDAERPEDREDEEARRSETPAQAFARRQEALAEKESHESENFLRRSKLPIQPLEHFKSQESWESRPQGPNRFPSRDVWEDTPESLMHEATVGTPEPMETANTSSPAVPARPGVPARPQKKLSTEKPAVPDRPKPKKTPPTVPARPTKTLPSGTDSKEQDALPKPKPAVPARPMGSKIQALQAGFMSDLNRRLQMGPQMPPKREEPAAADMLEEEKEKAPLVDARKGRARGPQRRAPAKARSPAAAAADRKVLGAPTLSFSPLRSCWSIGDSGELHVDPSQKGEGEEKTGDRGGEDVADGKSEVETSPDPEPAMADAEPAADPQAAGADPEAVVDGISEPETKVVPSATIAAATEELEPNASEAENAAADAEAGGEQGEGEAVKTLASNMAGEPIVEAKVDEAESQGPGEDKGEKILVEEKGGQAE